MLCGFPSYNPPKCDSASKIFFRKKKKKEEIPEKLKLTAFSVTLSKKRSRIGRNEVLKKKGKTRVPKLKKSNIIKNSKICEDKPRKKKTRKNKSWSFLYAYVGAKKRNKAVAFPGNKNTKKTQNQNKPRNVNQETN